MEDDTSPRSLQTVAAAAIGLLLIGAGCFGMTEPPQSQEQTKETQAESQVQANAAPLGGSEQKGAVPFVACFRGEADLFSSTGNVTEVWIDQLRSELNAGWLIDIWCREVDGLGASQYAIALRRSQGVISSDLTSAVFSLEEAGYRTGGMNEISESDVSAWSLVKLAYIGAGKNRQNEIPLITSNMIAVKNEGKPVDSISFVRDVVDVSSSPRFVAAEVHGGSERGWFTSRILFKPAIKQLEADAYCRTYFDSEDGSFSPIDMKTECK